MIELGETKFFAGLEPVELARLLPELDEQSFRAGAVIFRRGEPGDSVYVVRAGVAEARASDGRPGDAALSLFEPGDSFGEMALLTDEPRSTTIVALTDLDLWVLPKDRFLRLIKQTPSVALAVGRQLSNRLRATSHAVSTMHRAFDASAQQQYGQLEPDLQRFLRRTAPLDPVSADVVACALDDTDAALRLRVIAERVPFFAAEAPGVYRYHRFFRELLLAKLTAELGEHGRRAWVHRLAECAVAAGRSEQAVELFVDAGDAASAARIVVMAGRKFLAAGHLAELDALLASLPPAVDAFEPEVLDVRAELRVAQGRLDAAVAVLEEACRRAETVAGADADPRLLARYRRLAELSFDLGHGREGMRWLRQSGEADAGGRRAMDELDPLGPLAADASRVSSERARFAIASFAGLRRVAETAGALDGRGVSRPIGIALSILALGWFALAPAPAGLSREAYLAFGILIAALPLLVFSVLADHLVSLLMVTAWAGFGLVPSRVALSGFATPGWFLVLAVLAVGAALARSGVLYRAVLAMLERVPKSHVVLTLALVLAGVAFSPAMPNATARTALAAPLVREIADTLGYPRRSRGSAALAMAVLLGFGQMCGLFLTGSSSGLLVHSLLPPASRARFGWVTWFIAALPLHVVIFAVTYFAIVLTLPPDAHAGRSLARLSAQRRILGAMSRAERVGVGVFIWLIVSFALGPFAGLDATWAAILAMVTLGAANVLDQHAFKTGVNWTFLIFFGVMLSLAEVFRTLGVDAWLASLAAAPLAPLAASPTLFLLAVGVAGYGVNLIVRWQAACVLMTLVLVPAVSPFGIEPWVVGITALVTTNMWFLPYQSTIYQALYYGADEEAFSHAQVRPVAFAYGAACLLGLVASVPVWRAMGLLP